MEFGWNAVKGLILTFSESDSAAKKRSQLLIQSSTESDEAGTQDSLPGTGLATARSGPARESRNESLILARLVSMVRLPYGWSR